MTRLMPDLAEDTAINMEEVALLFGTHDREEGARILTSDCGGCEVKIRSRIDGETGEEVFHLGDIEQVVDWRKQGGSARKRTPARSTAPAPSPVQLADDDSLTAILLSDQGGKGGAPAYSVTQVAERCGLEEGELQRRLVLGGAKLEVVDGRMLAAKVDVQRLIGSGSIPDPSKQSEESKTRTPTPDPFGTATDPAVEARSAAVAEAMGIDLGSKPDTAAGEPAKGTADATTQRASAQPRSRTRIGAPRRWGQR